MNQYKDTTHNASEPQGATSEQIPYALLSKEPINRMAKIIEGKPLYHHSIYENTPKAEWKRLIERSKNRVKNYPHWVKDSNELTDHERQHGFIKNGNFFLPMYGFFIDGERFPYHLPHAKISKRMADETKELLAKGKKIDLRITAFLELSEGDLVNDI